MSSSLGHRFEPQAHWRPEIRRMKILFLHGWQSIPGGVKPTFLATAGHHVLNPKLDDHEFRRALDTAYAQFESHRPNVVVGSSRGGAVALNLRLENTPLVLLCPAWKKWGGAQTCTPNIRILHSKADEVIPIKDSEELVSNSQLPQSTLIEVGVDHRLADPEPLQVMLDCCEELLGQ